MNFLSFFFFFNNVRKNMLGKFLLKNTYSLPLFSKILCTIVIQDSKYFLLNSIFGQEMKYEVLKYLESLTGQRSYVQRFLCENPNKHEQQKAVGPGGGDHVKDVFFCCRSTLVKKKIYNFFDFFLICFWPFILLKGLKYTVWYNLFCDINKNSKNSGFFILDSFLKVFNVNFLKYPFMKKIDNMETLDIEFQFSYSKYMYSSIYIIYILKSHFLNIYHDSKVLKKFMVKE